jgi:hypothetical protein
MTGDKGDVGKYSGALKVKWTTDDFLGLGPFKGKLVSSSGQYGAGYYGSETLPASNWGGAAIGPLIFESGAGSGC